MMTPAELRAAIPALQDAIYLNTGASGPSPKPVVEAARAELEEHAFRAHGAGEPYDFASRAFGQTREAVAQVVGAKGSEIALTNSTSHGMNIVANAIEWSAEDVVVRTDLEHAAGILPWHQLDRRYDVNVRVVETEAGYVPIDAYKRAVDGADLVTFSAITWTHGTRLDVERLTEIAHDAGAMVLVDAVQVPGQAALDIQQWGADFVAGAGHKWMLAPWGAGFLYVREEVAERLAPSSIGYRSVEDPYGRSPSYERGAKRFEIGTTSPAPYAGLRESIRILEDIGIDVIEDRIASLTGYLKDEIGVERLISPRGYESGLVTIRVDDPVSMVDRLAAENIVARSLPFPDALRVSAHAFNTREDIDALLTHLPA